MERATISRQQQTQRAFLGAALMDPARAREYIIKLDRKSTRLNSSHRL